LSGFEPIDRSDLQVRLGQTMDLPLTMRLGSITEHVLVVPVAPPVDLTTATIGAVLDSATLSRLPVGAASATRCILRRASAPAAAWEGQTRRSKGPAVSRTST